MNRMRLLAPTVLLMTVAPLALARAQRDDRPPQAPVSVIRLSPILAALDANQDGMISAAERGDADKNGILDPAELKKLATDQSAAAGGERRGGGPGGRGRGGPGAFDVAFNALDANHDGEISGDEIAQSAASLKTLDKNNDGAITEDEVRPPGDGRGGVTPRSAR
jgi:hypothetical protein